MGRVSKSESINAKIRKAQDNVKRYKALYESSQAELEKLLEERKKIQAEQLMKAMEKKGKSFDEVMRLINL